MSATTLLDGIFGKRTEGGAARFHELRRKLGTQGTLSARETFELDGLVKELEVSRRQLESDLATLARYVELQQLVKERFVEPNEPTPEHLTNVGTPDFAAQLKSAEAEVVRLQKLAEEEQNWRLRKSQRRNEKLDEYRASLQSNRAEIQRIETDHANLL